MSSEVPKFNKIEVNDIPKYQNLFSRDTIMDINHLEQNRPWIMLPGDFYNATIQMCQAERETRGVLLIAKNNEEFNKGRLPVSAMISIGYGTPTGVFPDDKKLNAINKFLVQYKNELMHIDFHSHTVGTGTFWEDKFSGGDNQSLANNANRHRGYMHVLFTPNNILTFGMGKPQFVVKDFDNNPLETQEKWKNKFDEFLRNE